jgi:hypothetical protein
MHEKLRSYFYFAAGGKEMVPGSKTGNDSEMRILFSFLNREPGSQILICHPGGGTKKLFLNPLNRIKFRLTQACNKIS